MPPRLSKAEVRRCGVPFRATFREILLMFGQWKVTRGGMPHRPSKAEVRRCGLPSRATFREILLIRIRIMKAKDRGKP